MNQIRHTEFQKPSYETIIGKEKSSDITRLPITQERVESIMMRLKDKGFDVVVEEEEVETVVAILSCGNKELLLDLFEKREFTTVLVSNDEKPIPGQVTQLYREAKKIMEELANKNEVPYCYSLYTKNTKMAEWARTTGATIFNWTSINERSEYASFDTVIYPRYTNE